MKATELIKPDEMKANELRIGNWIKHSEDDTEGNIDSIYGKEVFIEDWHLGTTPLNECEPIRLTEKWLFSFGYIDDVFSEYHYRIMGHRIWKCNESFFCDKNGVVLKYVHQLQNLYFALTGKELTLN